MTTPANPNIQPAMVKASEYACAIGGGGQRFRGAFGGWVSDTNHQFNLL
jgi:hypothetical protein